MPQITKISPQKRKKRVNIFIDEKFAFGIDLETFAKYSLRVDQELSQEEIEKIIKEGELQRVYDKALKFLSFRPRSEKEVDDYLNKKKVGEQTKKMVIEKLKKAKLLDDRQFALWWFDQRITFRPSGRRLLEYELAKKGIDQETLNRLLETRLTDDLEFKLAKEAAQKKLAAYQKLSPLEFHQKMTAFLARRGFSWEVIKEVIDGFFKKE